MEFCVLVLMIGIHTCYGGSLCGNVSDEGKSLSLSRGVNEVGTGCWCMLELISSNNDTVFVTERTQPFGCQYMLQFIASNGFSRNYSCAERDNFSFSLQHGESVMIQLVSGNNNTSGFTVNISLSTKSSNLSLTCNLPISTTIPPAPGTSNQNASTQTSDITTKHSPKPKQTYTTIPVLQSTVDGHSDTNPNTNDDSFVAIIGGSVGGVCVITAVVLILCCVNKRNRKRRINSPEDKKHVNGAKDELPIIMENDLYVSSDDVVQHNASNDQDASSDQDATSQTETNVEYAVVNKNKKPVYSVVNKNKKPVYAVVNKNKQPVYAVVNKHTNTLKNNNDSDGDKSNFMIGPDGDQYTIVNKD